MIPLHCLHIIFCPSVIPMPSAHPAIYPFFDIIVTLSTIFNVSNANMQTRHVIIAIKAIASAWSFDNTFHSAWQPTNKETICLRQQFKHDISPLSSHYCGDNARDGNYRQSSHSHDWLNQLLMVRELQIWCQEIRCQ